MTNGNGAELFNGSLKSRFVKEWGVLALIAIWLVWQLSSGFGAKLDRLNDHLDAHEVEAAKARAVISDEKRLLEVLVTIARASCVNAAKDELSRGRCLQQ